MAKKLPPNMHFQLRLVKSIDEKGKISTHHKMARPKGMKDDQTLDLYSNEQGILMKASAYCSRTDERKGPFPEPFLGVVVVKYESDPDKWDLDFPVGQHLKLNKRPRRMEKTTIWRYYIDSQSEAFYVDDKTHRIMGPVVRPYKLT